jgi:signal peptidase II
MPTVLVPLLLAFDQILKLWALENLSPIPRPLLGDLLYLTLVKNTGAGFGLLQDKALGNGVDRLGRGFVVDYLDLGTQIPLIAQFPVFNLADVCVTLGAAILLLSPRRRRRY